MKNCPYSRYCRGAAAVLAVMESLEREQVRVPVVGVLALAENAIGKDSYYPSQIIRSKNGAKSFVTTGRAHALGLSVEIGNTDAEGRLILADAMTMAQEQFKYVTLRNRRYSPLISSPVGLIELSTLTGACVVGLGEHTAGLFSNSTPMKTCLQKASVVSGDRVWPVRTIDFDISCDVS